MCAPALVFAGRRDGHVLDREHGRERDRGRRGGGCRPAAPVRRGASPGDDVAAGVDAEGSRPRGGEPLRRAGDRPALDEAGRVEAAGGAHGEEAARRALERQAAREHLVDLGAALGEGELAAVEPADVAVVAVGAEDRVDLAQPVEGRLDVAPSGSREVDADRHSHDVADLGPKRRRHERIGARWESPGQPRALRELSGCAQALPSAAADGIGMTAPSAPVAAAATALAEAPAPRPPAPSAPAPPARAPAAGGRGRPGRRGRHRARRHRRAGGDAESAGSLGAPGGIATALGRLTGLLAAYAMVVVVLLVARVPPLERAIGQDRLVAWHRKLGPWPLYLLLAHAVLITVGYARAGARRRAAPVRRGCC